MEIFDVEKHDKKIADLTCRIQEIIPLNSIQKQKLLNLLDELI